MSEQVQVRVGQVWKDAYGIRYEISAVHVDGSADSIATIPNGISSHPVSIAANGTPAKAQHAARRRRGERLLGGLPVSHQHERIVCSCGTLIMQCRCMESGRNVRVVQNGCDDCKRKGTPMTAAKDWAPMHCGQPATPAMSVPGWTCGECGAVFQVRGERQGADEACSRACPFAPAYAGAPVRHSAICDRLTDGLAIFRAKAYAAGRAAERERCLWWVDQVKLGDFATDWQAACDAIRLPIADGKEAK